MNFEDRLANIESLLLVLVERQQVKEWCRLGRIHAEKILVFERKSNACNI